MMQNLGGDIELRRRFRRHGLLSLRARARARKAQQILLSEASVKPFYQALCEGDTKGSE
jgi:hypothetical protein